MNRRDLTVRRVRVHPTEKYLRRAVWGLVSERESGTHQVAAPDRTCCPSIVFQESQPLSYGTGTKRVLETVPQGTEIAANDHVCFLGFWEGWLVGLPQHQRTLVLVDRSCHECYNRYEG